MLVILLQVWWTRRLPQDYEDKLIHLQRFVNPKKKLYDFELSQIGNAEQTPLTFEIVANTWGRLLRKE